MYNFSMTVAQEPIKIGQLGSAQVTVPILTDNGKKSKKGKLKKKR